MIDAEIQLGLALIFCFAFLAIGMKNAVFLVFAGFTWIIASLAVFQPYGIWLMLIGWGVGFLCLYEGVVKLG